MRWIVLLLASALLAGCAEPDGQPDACGWDDCDRCDDCGGMAFAAQLRGVVVDETITPLTGVHVYLAEADVAFETGADGRFAFGTLDPGTYTVTASLTFYETIQTSIALGAGGSEPIKIQLTRLIFDAPYVETAQFDGFLACSSNVGGIIAEECGEGAGVPGVGRVGTHPNNVPYVTFFAEGPRPQTIQGEILWDATLTVGNGVQEGGFTAIMATHFACDPVCGYEHSLDDKVGHSPLVMRTDDGDQGGGYFTAPDVAMVDAGITPETPITVFIWTSDEELAAVTVEQPFTVYRTVSFVLPLPEGWSFADGDADPF